MTKHAVLKKIIAVLTTSKPKAKDYCYGYIVALVDAGYLSQSEYDYLRDTVALWRKGDTVSGMIIPHSFREENP